MLQPDGAKEGVIALLVEEELPVPAKAGVNLPMLVKVGGVGPAAIIGVQV